ncbi:unnamed protein product [Mycena citricolor]|uniref:Uncharacterized protein n=1 Tax=Mycena citricolor TaxID=2018698 RepID=A0AAD2HBK1_9AGAR|nr:unnamed protein product [Mycena citricolor]CAK5273104.1 unnamed protein product [Mycena citricolor]CAK5273109.1 unnamed protein product [Mycena citricolor]CAK5273110.1 unnamed protein product [Mycena citricolor]CAK5273133.1 unnamed protein product [Mycena citricolor]
MDKDKGKGKALDNDNDNDNDNEKNKDKVKKFKGLDNKKRKMFEIGESDSESEGESDWEFVEHDGSNFPPNGNNNSTAANGSGSPSLFRDGTSSGERVVLRPEGSEAREGDPTDSNNNTARLRCYTPNNPTSDTTPENNPSQISNPDSNNTPSSSDRLISPLRSRAE